MSIERWNYARITQPCDIWILVHSSWTDVTAHATMTAYMVWFDSRLICFFDPYQMGLVSKDFCGNRCKQQAPRQCTHIAPDRLWPSELMGAPHTVSTQSCKINNIAQVIGSRNQLAWESESQTRCRRERIYVCMELVIINLVPSWSSW